METESYTSAPKSAFLTSSLVRLILLVQGTHHENHWSKIVVVRPSCTITGGAFKKVLMPGFNLLDIVI